MLNYWVRNRDANFIDFNQETGYGITIKDLIEAEKELKGEENGY